MPVARDIDKARYWFSEDVKEAAPVIFNPRIVEAFCTVPREHYLGGGPWGIHSRLNVGSVHRSASAEPHHLYHDVLVSIDDASGINNGLPSLWAMVFDNLDIEPGQTILQVGAGVGYYTAILAELVKDQGSVIAYEIECDLAKRARKNLKHYPQVKVVYGSATDAERLPSVNAVVACAGVTHIPEIWLDCLSHDGQMVLPFTGKDQWGFLLHLARKADRLPVKSLGPCGFYHCSGARTTEEEKALSIALKAATGSDPDIGHYHIGKGPDNLVDAWLSTDRYWISK